MGLLFLKLNCLDNCRFACSYKRWHIPCTFILFPPMFTSCKTPARYHKQDIAIATSLLSPSDLPRIYLHSLGCVYWVLCNFTVCVVCTFTTRVSPVITRTSPVALLYHTCLSPLPSPSSLHIPNPFTVPNPLSSFIILTLRMVPKWNHTARNLLWPPLLSFFTWYNSPDSHPGCCVHQYVDSIYCQTASYVGMNHSLFACSRTAGHLGCVWFSAILNKAAVHRFCVRLTCLQPISQRRKLMLGESQ